MFSRDFFAALPQNLILLAAGVCLSLALAMAVATQRYLMEDAIGAESEVSFPGQHFSRVWFDGEGQMMGARQTEAGVEWRALNPETKEWAGGGVIAGPLAGAHWDFERRGKMLAWTEQDRRLCAAAPGGDAASCVPLPPAQATVRGVTMLGPDTVGVVYGNGELRQWTPGKPANWTPTALSVKAVDLIAHDPDTLAVYSKADGAVGVYRLGLAEGGPKLIEVRPVKQDPEGLLVTAPGQVAVVGADSVEWLDKTLKTPGKVRSAVAALTGGLVVAGDFGGVHALWDDGKSQVLVESTNPVEAVATSEYRIGFAGSSGTSVVRLLAFQRPSEEGSLVIRSTSFLMSLGLTMGILSAGLFAIGNTKGKPKKKESASGPGQLAFPTPELIEGLCRRGGVLWSGAGLSAQSGFPLWHDFIFKLIQAAFYEGWVSSADGTRLNEMVRKGESEEAADELGRLARDRRPELVSHYQSVFDRYAPAAEAHRSLTRLPLIGAITTNYDQLLDNIGAGETLLDHSGFRLLECTRNGEFFLLKLYGDPRRGSSVLLTRGEFNERVRTKPDLRAAISSLMEDRTMIFVGTSLDGLIDDLRVLGLPPSSGGIRHFVVTGVRGDWEPKAEILARQYGIATFACDSEKIGEQLPGFLDRVAEMCRDAQGSAGDPAEGVEMEDGDPSGSTTA